MHPTPSIVMLHASASSSRQWDALVAALQGRFRVHAVDLHGHGARPAWQAGASYALADEAALAAPMLAAPGGAHLVGHSYGAAVALKLASLYPTHVRSIVAYEPVMFGWLRGEDELQEVVSVARSMRDDLSRGRQASAARRFVDLWSGPSAWGSMSARTRDSIACRAEAMLMHFDALFGESLSLAQLGGVHAPMLFLTGADTMAPMRRMAEVLRAALPRAKHQIVPGAAHMGPMTHAGDVNQRIVDRLAYDRHPGLGERAVQLDNVLAARGLHDADYAHR